MDEREEFAVDASARYWARQRGDAGDGLRLVVVSDDDERKRIWRSPAGGPLAEDLAVALDEERPGRVEEYVARAWQAIVRALDPGGPPQHRLREDCKKRDTPLPRG